MRGWLALLTGMVALVLLNGPVAAGTRTGGPATTAAHATLAAQVSPVTIADVVGFATFERTAAGKIRVVLAMSGLAPGNHTARIRKLSPAGVCVGAGPALRNLSPVIANTHGVVDATANVKMINGNLHNLLVYRGVGTVLEVRDGPTTYCGVLFVG